jgi:hypothetical protein
MAFSRDDRGDEGETREMMPIAGIRNSFAAQRIGKYCAPYNEMV